MKPNKNKTNNASPRPDVAELLLLLDRAVETEYTLKGRPLPEVTRLMLEIVRELCRR